MIKVLFILCTLVFITCNANVDYKKSTIIKCEMDTIEEYNLNYYIGKPVSVLIDSIECDIIYERTFSDRPAYLSGVKYILKSGLIVFVSVTEYNYVTPFSLDLNWDLELFRKEKINSIQIFKQSKLIYSTNNK